MLSKWTLQGLLESHHKNVQQLEREQRREEGLSKGTHDMEIIVADKGNSLS